MRLPAPLRWLRSLQGQILLAMAVALLIAQAFSAWLIWTEIHQRHVGTLVNNAAVRMLGDRVLMPRPDERNGHGHGPPLGAFPDPPQGAFPSPPQGEFPSPPQGAFHSPPPLTGGGPAEDRLRLPRQYHVHIDTRAPLQPGDVRLPEVETALHDVLVSQGETPGQLIVVMRDPARDPLLQPVLGALVARFRVPGAGPVPTLVVAAQQQSDGTWLTVRSFMQTNERQLLMVVLRQTVLTYLVLVTVVGLILRRITRPLRALTGRLENFSGNAGGAEPMVPQGPQDIRQLIVAHNAMEARIGALLDEKDVMLGAIGHDLKTPLAALRVRIEAVEDDGERVRMAATIDDLSSSLDDILSLARVGRPSDPLENNEVSALVDDIIGEYEDMGEDVVLGETTRMVAPLRATWLRRALRNLVSNALRYGERARVSLMREGRWAVLRVEDDGPGIPSDAIARMMEPFTRLDPSRNSATGGAGLGLALARAIAEQHGGSLTLANRVDQGRIVGLAATLRLPLA